MVIVQAVILHPIRSLSEFEHCVRFEIIFRLCSCVEKAKPTYSTLRHSIDINLETQGIDIARIARIFLYGEGLDQGVQGQCSWCVWSVRGKAPIRA